MPVKSAPSLSLSLSERRGSDLLLVREARKSRFRFGHFLRVLQARSRLEASWRVSRRLSKSPKRLVSPIYSQTLHETCKYRWSANGSSTSTTVTSRPRRAATRTSSCISAASLSFLRLTLRGWFGFSTLKLESVSKFPFSEIWSLSFEVFLESKESLERALSIAESTLSKHRGRDHSHFNTRLPPILRDVGSCATCGGSRRSTCRTVRPSCRTVGASDSKEATQKTRPGP